MTREYSRTVVITLFIVSVVFGGCSDDPTQLPVPPVEELEGDFHISINEGGGFSNDEIVTLTLSCPQADSVFVWNDDQGSIEGGTGFAMVDPQLVLDNWPLPSGEGQKPVLARFIDSSGRESPAIGDTIILDQTPPHVLPQVVFPESGAVVSSAVALSWTSGGDEWSSTDDLLYTVYGGSSAQNQEVIYQGDDLAVLVPGLVPEQMFNWELTCTDAAGNTSEIVAGNFETWEWSLPVFRFAPSGSFMMGSPESEYNFSDWERQHWVVLTNPFLIGETEITYQMFIPVLQWAYDQGLVRVEADGVYDNSIVEGEKLVLFEPMQFIEFQDGVFHRGGSSMEKVAKTISWYGAAAFCDWLNELSGIDPVYDRENGWTSMGGDFYSSRGFRLPMEAEWEYSCRAGTTTAFANGDMSGTDCYDPVLDEIGWYCGNYHYDSGLPAQKIPNPWGLYDMHGGVSEWCYDWEREYDLGPITNPVSEEPTARRIARGGGSSFPVHARKCRSGARATGYPDTHSTISVRLVFSWGE